MSTIEPPKGLPTLRKSKWLNDWFVMEPASDGYPEGMSGEWRDILDAVAKRESVCHYRVAVHFDDTLVCFYSPRNSECSHSVVIPLAQIDEWVEYAKQVISCQTNKKME